MVYTKKWFGYQNVCLEMVELGHAVVYEGKVVEFGKDELRLRSAESIAKKAKLGLWKAGGESPFKYKKRTSG